MVMVVNEVGITFQDITSSIQIGSLPLKGYLCNLDPCMAYVKDK